MVLVSEGVLEPSGAEPREWRFGAEALPRARRALRLQRDLELDVSALALVLDLLDRVEDLESRLRRLGRS
jgi:chaperone modulatory protein CbpM